MLQFKNILLPVDFSEFGEKSMVRLRQLLGDGSGVTIHFIHVWTPQYTVVPDDPTAEYLEKLEKISADFDAQDDKRCEVLTGHPSSEIGTYAKKNGCDVIVMPTHGRSGLKHLLIGSTAEQVARHAPCPVLLLRTSDNSTGKDK